MTRTNPSVNYLDGFAGPGEYDTGEDGSPLLVLKIAQNHQHRSGHLHCIFVENDARRLEHLTTRLVSHLEATPLPPGVTYETILGSFDETMSGLLDKLTGRSTPLAPTFALIDPFGYSDTPMDVIARIMANPKCEVLITFMYEYINRFTEVEHAREWGNLDRLFGTDHWREVLKIDQPADRRAFLHDLYLRQLRLVAGAKYVRSFEMINDGNRTEYFLMFGTNHILGLKRMKEAMWKADAASGTQFRDATDSNQGVLFTVEPDYDLLGRLICDLWSWPMDVPIDGLEEWVVSETPFRETHLRKALRPMEKNGVIWVKSGRQSTGYPQGCVIQFTHPDEWTPYARSLYARA